MSPSEQPKKAGTTILWVLGAFAGFAVLFSLIMSMTSSKLGQDPRADDRLANTAEITKVQTENLEKIGFNDAAKKQAVLDKSLAALGGKKPAASTQVVPGSPTQLKQAAASAAPAAAAPAPTAPPVAPAPAPTSPPAVPAPAATAPPAVPAPAPTAPPAVPAPAPTAPPAVPAPAPTAPPAVPAPAPTAPPAAPAPAPTAPPATPAPTPVPAPVPNN